MSALIPGIYNYCDRWCERCIYIERCSVGREEMEYWEKEKLAKNEEERKELFLAQMDESFASIQGLLEKFAEREGIDLAAIDLADDKEYREKQAAVEKTLKNDETIKDGRRYAKMVRDLVEGKWEEIINPEELIKAHDLGITSEKEIMRHLEEVEKHASIVRYYCHFIPVKIQRAIRGKVDDPDYELFTELEQDYNGSAKIAGIAINRSIMAWVALIDLLPDIREDAISMLALLQKLQRALKDRFPFAEQFVRPGFDTED